MRVHTRLLQTAAAPAVAGITLLAGATPAWAHESHTVQPGETLSHIAEDYGVTVDAIATENQIGDPDRVRVGQVLSIPHTGGSPSGAGASGGPRPVDPADFPPGSYTVQSGDSLSRIGVRFGVPWRDIARINGIGSPYTIRVGQILKVPGSAADYPNLPGRILDDPARLAILPSLERWSAHYGVPTDLLMAVAWQESGWRNDRVSSAGAFGIGQIMPATGEWIASKLIGDPTLDRSEPQDNIQMSAAYLGWLLREMGDEEQAIASYYQGQGSVRANGWYESTHSYVANVQSHRRMFQRR